MNRCKNVYAFIYKWDNLVDALGMVRKGKTQRGDMLLFMQRWQEHLEEIQAAFMSERFDLGHYTSFKIFEPKERIIHAATIRERIMHHAVIGVVGGVLERPLIDDTYACRLGLGQWKAVYRAKDMARRHPWCLKLDIRHYFDSIVHEIIYAMLERLLADRPLLNFFRQLLDSYSTRKGRGLPIGNLTSQYMANLYLSAFDRFCQGKGREYVRYMDDMLVFGEKEELKEKLLEAKAFLDEKLGLELKNGGLLVKVSNGIDFLGCRVYPGKIELNRRSKARLFKKVQAYDSLFARGMMSERELQERLTALFAFAGHADTFALRGLIVEREEHFYKEADERYMLS